MQNVSSMLDVKASELADMLVTDLSTNPMGQNQWYEIDDICSGQVNPRFAFALKLRILDQMRIRGYSVVYASQSRDGGEIVMFKRINRR